MVRTLWLLAVLAACGSERTPVTTKVATLGYSHPPLVVVVGFGPTDLVEPWIAGLRGSKYVKVVGELMKPDGSRDSTTTCRDARESVDGAPLEEIIVIDAVPSEVPITDCLDQTLKTGCSSRYVGQTLNVSTTVTAYRASTCTHLRSTSLPLASGSSATRPPIEMYGSGMASASNEVTLDDAKAIDSADARAKVIERIGEFAPRVSWNVFPTDSSIQIVEDDKIIIAGPLKLGEYFLKVPSSAELHPGIQVVNRTTNSSTLQVDRELKPEPGDELHTVTDMLLVSGYTMVSGGTARSNGKTNGLAGAALAARWSWEHFPGMFEMQFGGDLVPGVDSRHLYVSAAAGLRVPYWISPVAFIELGLGGVYQGDDGARAVAGHAGVGVGLEVRRSRWFAFADARLRGFALGDWTDSDDKPLDVTYPDNTWQTATGQLGLGFNY